MRGRILVIDYGTPTPDQDSGSASTFAYLRVLTAAGFHLTFAEPHLADAGPYTRALTALGIDCLLAPEWGSLDDVIRRAAPQADILLLYRGGVANVVFDLARQVAPAAKIVFHPVDLHFLRLEREATISRDPAAATDAERMRELELSLIRRADAAIVVSSYEAALLREIAPGATVHHIPIMRATPMPPPGFLGWRRFCARRGGGLAALARRGLGPGKRRDIVFIGGYRHRPNVDAMLWFTREIWPLVLAAGFRDRLILAGSYMPPEISALASDTIEIRGQVADLPALFDACRLSIAPLRYGGGVKGKIVSSLSLGLPVVATSMAAEGMALRDGENILIADEPAAFARQIMRLYGDARLWRRLSARGFAAFRENFSEDATGPKVVAVFDGLMARRNA